MPRFSLVGVSLLWVLASGCVAHVHGRGPVSRRPPPPPPPAQVSQYTYQGAHPMPEEDGGGWCTLDYVHTHRYNPGDDYVYSSNAYVYQGPTVVWYSDYHPIPGGGACGYYGRHYHDYFPIAFGGASYGWDRGRSAYYYRNYRYDGPRYSSPRYNNGGGYGRGQAGNYHEASPGRGRSPNLAGGSPRPGGNLRPGTPPPQVRSPSTPPSVGGNRGGYAPPSRPSSPGPGPGARGSGSSGMGSSGRSMGSPPSASPGGSRSSSGMPSGRSSGPSPSGGSSGRSRGGPPGR